MRILAYPHNLKIGGAQILAVNLAAATRKLGHDVIIFAPSGPLADVAVSNGLTVIEQSLPDGRRPSLRAMTTLREVVRREHVDLVHAHTHSTSLEAFFGTYAMLGVPLVCSDMGMKLPEPFPSKVPFVLCTRHLQEQARRSRSGSVYLLEPPVDTENDHPSVDAAGFRQTHELDDARLNIVIVSRLEIPLKAEGLVTAIDAVALAAKRLPVRLIVVGGGTLYDELCQLAEGVNRRLGDRIVLLTGPMLDPRPAYATADVILGMGSSILRGMAFGKPAIVLGVRGFSEIVMPSTLHGFLWEGFFGRGDGQLQPQRLCGQLLTILTDRPLRNELGLFSREMVCEKYSLNAAAKSLEGIYQEVAGQNPALVSRVREVAGFARSVVLRKLRKTA